MSTLISVPDNKRGMKPRDKKELAVKLIAALKGWLEYASDADLENLMQNCKEVLAEKKDTIGGTVFTLVQRESWVTIPRKYNVQFIARAILWDFSEVEPIVMNSPIAWEVYKEWGMDETDVPPLDVRSQCTEKSCDAAIQRLAKNNPWCEDDFRDIADRLGKHHAHVERKTPIPNGVRPVRGNQNAAAGTPTVHAIADDPARAGQRSASAAPNARSRTNRRDNTVQERGESAERLLQNGTKLFVNPVRDPVTGKTTLYGTVAPKSRGGKHPVEAEPIPLMNTAATNKQVAPQAQERQDQIRKLKKEGFPMAEIFKMLDDEKPKSIRRRPASPANSGSKNGGLGGAASSSKVNKPRGQKPFVQTPATIALGPSTSLAFGKNPAVEKPAKNLSAAELAAHIRAQKAKIQAEDKELAEVFGETPEEICARYKLDAETTEMVVSMGLENSEKIEEVCADLMSGDAEVGQKEDAAEEAGPTGEEQEAEQEENEVVSEGKDEEEEAEAEDEEEDVQIADTIGAQKNEPVNEQEENEAEAAEEQAGDEDVEMEESPAVDPLMAAAALGVKAE